MPKYHKKPKGTAAHQHQAGEDWTKADAWIQDWIADGRLVVTESDAAVVIGGVAYPVQPTDWIVADVGLMTDAQFSETYESSAVAFRSLDPAVPHMP